MATNIKENWKRIEEIEKDIREQTGDPNAGFNANLFFFGGQRCFIINARYRGKKGKKGQEELANLYKEIAVYAQFCPFTGLPLYEQQETKFNQKTEQNGI